ncbi:MAG: hypothetical protein NVS1B13_00110 [Flavisolibacter sp.]
MDARRLIIFVFLLWADWGNTNSYHPLRLRLVPPDYNDLSLWAAHPWKWNPADSIPLALVKEGRDTMADVFFIHPTTYIGLKHDWNADLINSSINNRTDLTTILYQASVFNQHCRVFAPRYRQVHISAFFIHTKASLSAFDTAYADIKAAFEHYLKFYNKGRPIIVAGHSQGAKMAEHLLKDFFDGKPLQNKLVAAYVIGWPLPRDYFTAIPVCARPNQTGCFCGWRTYRKEYIPAYIENETTLSYVTNPLSWDTSHNYISPEKNLGSLLKNFNQIVPHTTGAQVHGGVLWIDRPKFRGSFLYRTKNYHIADLNLFYMNMRQNISDRIFAFKASNQIPK